MDAEPHQACEIDARTRDRKHSGEWNVLVQNSHRTERSVVSFHLTSRGPTAKKLGGDSRFGSLPTNALVRALTRSRSRGANEIDDYLRRIRALQGFTKGGIGIADHDRVRVVEDIVDRLHHQSREMRHMLLDVCLVRAREPRQAHIAVVETHVVALTDQVLDQRDDRALPQVVGASLEAEAEHADSFPRGARDHLDTAFDLSVVAA